MKAPGIIAVAAYSVLVVAVGLYPFRPSYGGVPDLVCYEGGDEAVKPEFELTNMSMTVHWFDTVPELQEATGRRDAEALSSCEHYEDLNMAFCEIWVVRPARVLGDAQMDSLGHEVLHGLMGDFHE